MITIVEYYLRIILTSFTNQTKAIIGFGLIALIAISIYHNGNAQLNRYSPTAKRVINPNMFEVEPYLRSMGITASDKVVCVPDRSLKTSLNAINNYGWTEIFYNDSYNIHYFQKAGAAYLIISDSSYLHHPLYQPFTKKQVGYYRGIYIFDIRQLQGYYLS